MPTTGQPLPYTPSAPADNTDQSRAVWDEFYKISQLLSDMQEGFTERGSGILSGTGTIGNGSWSGKPLRSGSLVTFPFTVNIIDKGTGGGALFIVNPPLYGLDVAHPSYTGSARTPAGELCYVYFSAGKLVIYKYNNTSAIENGIISGSISYALA